MKLNNKDVKIIYIGAKQVRRIVMYGSVVYEYNEPVGHSLSIVGPFDSTGETCQLSALYDNEAFDISLANWSVVAGNEYATINSSGLMTISSSASGNGVTVQCIYQNMSAQHIMQVTYVSGGSTETTTETTVDPITGDVTTVVETVIDNGDGSSTSNTITTVTDENGETIGSNETNATQNADGSSSSTSTNYDAEGNPTDQTNQNIDTSGNESTQQIEYDENGDPEVTGYTIDTTGNPDGEKTFNVDGVNTEFYGFDEVDGFVLRIHFTFDFTQQPANQNENHHNILTMKRATPTPWYGFQLRQTGTNKYIILGTQFATGSNTNTNISPSWITTNKLGEYDIQIVYDPTRSQNRFVSTNLLTNTTIYTSNNLFPDIPELRYLTVCIGYALDANGNPYRYSNVNILDFTITKIK